MWNSVKNFIIINGNMIIITIIIYSVSFMSFHIHVYVLCHTTEKKLCKRKSVVIIYKSELLIYCFLCLPLEIFLISIDKKLHINLIFIILCFCHQKYQWVPEHRQRGHHLSWNCRWWESEGITYDTVPGTWKLPSKLVESEFSMKAAAKIIF